jgi:phage terminase small subunit
MTTLTPKQETFAQHLARPDSPGVLKSYELAGYSVAAKNPEVSASKLANDPKIVQRINELRNAAAAPVIADATMILREWLTIATADPSELIRGRRLCCRYCYGFEHRYQFRDEEEYAQAIAEAIDYNASRKRDARERELPVCDGGFGYNPTLTPHAKCPSCFGEGSLDVFVPDLASVSPAARKLYAGIKTTQHGVEIKLRDQDGALANIAKYLGMFVEKHEHSGPNGGPIPAATVVAEMPAKAAADIYARVMQGK